MQIGLVGATNVGKSTLFNRLIGQFRAIVTDVHGTTQDILRHDVNDSPVGPMVYADSPGLASFEQERPFIVKLLEESVFVFFVIDSKVGLTAKEHQINEYIQQHGLEKKVILVLNKLDKPMDDDDYLMALSEYYAMGYEHIVGVSAKTGQNVGMLRNLLYELINNTDTSHLVKKARPKYTQIAIVGKPNAGKSTLMNTLAKDEISKVEDVAGTTLDYVSQVIEYNGTKYEVLDTAGIKKKSKTRGLEKIAYDKTIGMLKYMRPVVVYMLDITQGLTHRDLTLIEEIHNKALPFIVAVNKTDTVKKEYYKKYVDDLADRFSHMKYVPIVPLSGLEGKGLGNLFKMIQLVYKESRKKLSTGELNSMIKKEFIMRPPRFPKNKICKIFYVTQMETNPPKFVVFVNHTNRANFSFKRWLENTIRKYHGFVGVPLVLIYRGREKTRGRTEQEHAEIISREMEEHEEN